MATPDPESFSLLSKVLAAATAIVVPLGAIYKLGSSALEKKADKADLDEVKKDIDQRKTIEAKLFDKFDEHSRRDEELFRDVIKTMGTNHAEVMKALGAKADR